MQLIGQPIKHVTFGKGVVTDWNGNVITVCFSAGEKKFIYPDAFSNFLILKNADAQKKVQHRLDVREEERETELKELQEQQEKKHMLENLKKNRLLKKGFWYHAAGRCMEGPSFLHTRQSAGERDLKTR